VWYCEGRLGKLQQKFRASGADNWAILGRGYGFIIFTLFIFSSSLFYIIYISLMYLPSFTAQHKRMHASSLFLLSVLRKGLCAWKLFFPFQLHLIEYITSPCKSLFSFFHHSSSNAAVITLVIYPIKQLTCAWITNSKSPQSFTRKENIHIMVCCRFEKDPFAEQSTGTKL